MHLTVVLGASGVHLGVWRDAVSVAMTRVPLRSLSYDTRPALTTGDLHAAIESGLEQLRGQVELGGVTSLNGAAYDASLASTALDNQDVHDAFSGTTGTVPLTRWASITFLGALHEVGDHDGDYAKSRGRTGAYWRTNWNLDCTVLSFLPLPYAAALSVAPSPRDLLVLHDDIDAVILPSADPLTATVIFDPNGLAARKMVRDRYANGRWSVLAHLALRFGPGGSDGVDDKRFAFIQDSGTVRFEHGTPVDDFHDLRAITRCIFDSQALNYRRAAGTTSPARIVLLTEEENPAVPQILSTVFNCSVVAPLLPIATGVPGAAAYGAALLASSAGNVGKMRATLQRVSAPRPRSSSSPTTLTASPSLSRTISLHNLKLTPPSNSTPKSTPSVKRGPPASPELDSHSRADPAPWLHVVQPAPTNMWESMIYAAMMPEFTRIRTLVDSGVAVAFPAKPQF